MRSLEILVMVLVVGSRSISSQQLVAVLASGTSPNFFNFPAVYDGDNSVFMFGGYTGSIHNTIHRYTLPNGAATLVANLPSDMDYGAAVSVGRNGKIYYIGYRGNPDRKIFEFSPVTYSLTVVGNLPPGTSTNGMISLGLNKLLVFDLNFQDVFEFDTKSKDVSFVHRLPIEMSGYDNTVTWDGLDSVFVVGTDSSNEQRVIKYTPSRNESTVVPVVWKAPLYQNGGVGIGRYILLVGGKWSGTSTSNDLTLFDTVTLTKEEFSVQGFPGTTSYEKMAVVYVEKLNRVYMFGGYLCSLGSCSTTRNIYYIDLNTLITPPPPTTTTPIPDPTSPKPTTSEQSTEPTTEPTTSYPTTESEVTTTVSPDIFSCLNKTDGMYPHPGDCVRFIACRSGDGTEFECPTPLLFDPLGLTCNVASVVICDLKCTDKSDGLHPHPEDCKLFMICEYGITRVYECPDPLLFNPVLLRCDFPDLVECQSVNR